MTAPVSRIRFIASYIRSAFITDFPSSENARTPYRAIASMSTSSSPCISFVIAEA